MSIRNTYLLLIIALIVSVFLIIVSFISRSKGQDEPEQNQVGTEVIISPAPIIIRSRGDETIDIENPD